MSLMLAVANLERTAISRRIHTVDVRYHRLGPPISFAEKIRVSRPHLQLLAASAKRRQAERELQVAVIDSQALIHNLLAASLRTAQKKIKPFAVDLIRGKETYQAESIGRRIISQQEIKYILIEASRQISETWKIPFEPVSKALLATADITACSLRGSAAMTAQYKNTVAIAEMMYQAVSFAYEKSLDAISPHWLVKETMGNFNIVTAVWQTIACHPEYERNRCTANMEKCIDGMLTNVYYQLSRRCAKQLAHVMYSLYQPPPPLPPRQTVSGSESHVIASAIHGFFYSARIHK